MNDRWWHDSDDPAEPIPPRDDLPPPGDYDLPTEPLPIQAGARFVQGQQTRLRRLVSCFGMRFTPQVVQLIRRSAVERTLPRSIGTLFGQMGAETCKYIIDYPTLDI